ncbi:MAG: hypothetical protein K1000chlam4_00379 [Chlamydiae bacterium]|nr:hypothetical protein [Chlamydiota bacterium]
MSNYTIKELPKEERPRERLISHGPETMKLAELIAIIVSSGTKGKSALELGQEIVATFPNLGDATVQELAQIKGMGQTKAIQLKAALSLASRIAAGPNPPRFLVDNPVHAYNLIKERVQYKKKEIFGAILLDTKGGVIRWEEISVGTLNQTLVHPREVFQPAIRHGAATMILVHNHPSGDCTPSLEDYRVTEKLVSASRLMQIPVRDHLVVSSEGYFSMREHKEFLFY